MGRARSPRSPPSKEWTAPPVRSGPSIHYPVAKTVTADRIEGGLPHGASSPVEVPVRPTVEPGVSRPGARPDKLSGPATYTASRARLLSFTAPRWGRECSPRLLPTFPRLDPRVPGFGNSRRSDHDRRSGPDRRSPGRELERQSRLELDASGLGSQRASLLHLCRSKSPGVPQPHGRLSVRAGGPSLASAGSPCSRTRTRPGPVARAQRPAFRQHAGDRERPRPE